MAAPIVWYATNNLASVHQEMSENSPGNDATTSPITGWIVGTTASARYSVFNSQVEQAMNTFGTTVTPDGTIDSTIGDCLRSENTYNGTFALGTWNFQFAGIAVTNGGAQDGICGFRLFSGAAADGSDAVEQTLLRAAGSEIINLGTAAQALSTASVVIAGFSVQNEYIFVQLGWQITGPGGMVASDVDMRIGNTATIITSPDFTASAVAATSKFLPLLGVGT